VEVRGLEALRIQTSTPSHTTAADAAHALHLAAGNDFHVAVVGYRLCGSSMNGLQLITRLHDANPFTVPLLMTDHDKGEVGFRVARLGAFGYLTKPFGRRNRCNGLVSD